MPLTSLLINQGNNQIDPNIRFVVAVVFNVTCLFPYYNITIRQMKQIIWSSGGVKESTHVSQRVGHVASGVVVWLCFMGRCFT